MGQPFLGIVGGGIAGIAGAGADLLVAANWDALPATAQDGDLAITQDDGLTWQWREVSGDGQWLPADVTYEATLAYRADVNANLCRLRLADANYPATWLAAGATKSANNPLAIASGSGSSYLAAELPASVGGLYLMVVIPTALGAGVAWVAYMGGRAGGNNLLPGAYVTPSTAVVGNLSGAQATAGGASVPAAGRPVFIVHDDRGAERITRVIVPGNGTTYHSSTRRDAIATNPTPYFGATNLAATGFSLDYIGAFEVT